MLAEMDEQFGIADLMSEVVKEEKRKVVLSFSCGLCLREVHSRQGSLGASSPEGGVASSGV